MSLYLPNPCLLGIFLTISTYDGPQLVFHYPPRPNEYGYKATPLAQEKTYLQSTGAVEHSSSSSSDDDSSGDDEGVSADDADDGSSSFTTRNNSNRTDSFNTNRSSNLGGDNNDYLSGKALLDILDEQDRKRKRKETKKKKLMKNLIAGNHDHTITSSSQHNSSHHTATTGAREKTQRDTTSHATSHTTNKAGTLSSLNKLFGFDIDLLSELITPAKNLCNTRFEITMDELCFLGLPIHVYEDDSWKKSSRSRAKSSKKMSKRSYSMKNSSDEDSHGDEEEGEDVEEGEGAENGEHKTNNGEIGGEVDDNTKNRDDKQTEAGQHNKKDHKDEKCPMNMFHLVFALNPPVIEYNHRIDEMYHYITSRLSLVLRYEQHKSNFVYKESIKIMNIKEENHSMPLNELWLKLINESSLANIIYQTYESVLKNDIVSVDINGKIRSFQIPLKNQFTSLPPTTVSILRGSYLSSINPLFRTEQADDDDHNGMLMHFALLLLDDADVIIKDIQAEKDSIIANFIKLIKPTESMSRLSTVSGLELNQIFSFCFHLVLWRRAIIVPPLQTRNVYIVSPLAPLRNLQNDANIFKTQFSSLPTLPTFLSMLSAHSKPRPYSTLLPSRDHRELYLDALGWLIKTGYALQLHTFLWLKVTPKIRVAVEEEIEMENFKKKQSRKNNGEFISSPSDSTAAPPTATDNLVDNVTQNLEKMDVASNGKTTKKERKIVVVEEEDTILYDPERATAIERRWINKIIEGEPPELITLFHKILKYLNGKYALEMILVKENISRQDIKRLLSHIDDYTVIVKHW